MINAAVVSSGGWGTALAISLAANNHHPYLLSYCDKEAAALNAARENKPFLPGVPLPDSIHITADAELALSGADFIINTTSTKYIRATYTALAPYIKKEAIIINASKGLEDGSLMRISEIFAELCPHNPHAALTGPSHAEEVARGVPTAIVAASADEKTAAAVQNLFMSPVFRVYTSADVIGAELGGALKNVIALAAGASDGIGCGDNTKAALMTRGIAEIARLGVKMGAAPMTFAGLAGIGDLIVTCTSMHSRNRRCGILLGEGKPLAEALAEVAMVVEGVNTAHAAYALAQKNGVEMPIIREVYNVLFEGKDPKKAVLDLMTRGKTAEKAFI